jgi:hypothetical protein
VSDRTPPKIALWLLQQCGSGYCAESLAGDLIEEYRRGRSVSWLWLQVATAVGLALLRFMRTMRWTRALRRKPAHSLAGALTLAVTLVFGVIVLGVGSPTQADTARGSTQADSFGNDTAQSNASAPGGTDTAQCNANAPGGAAENSVPESSTSQSGLSQRGERRCPQ